MIYLFINEAFPRIPLEQISSSFIHFFLWAKFHIFIFVLLLILISSPHLLLPPPHLWFQHANLVAAPQRDSLARSPILAAILLPPLWDPKINIPGPNKIITDTN